MRGGLVDYRLNEPRPPGRRISWNPRTENVRRVQIAGGSHNALTSTFEHPQNTAAPQYSPLMPHRKQEM